MLNDFIERKEYSTNIKELDDLLEDSNHLMIYQESIMKYLIWLGIKESESYDIIKKIAKKKFKEKELKELKENLLYNWKNKIGNENGFNETWQVVEDAAKYSFNASHSLSYAYDSLYGAYLKSHYPIEYYVTALNFYWDDQERTSKLIEELKYFKIKLKPILFGISRAKYSFDKNTNSIYKGIGSIKFLNEDVSEELFKLSKNKYTNFTDLLIDIKTKTSTNSRQLDILIKLDFFSDFGNSKELLNIVEVADVFKFGTAKTIKKDKIEGSYITSFIDKYATDKNIKGNELKNYTILDCRSLIVECEKYIKSLNIEDIDLRNKIINQQEYLGYISANGKEEDRPILFVQDVKTLRRKSDNKQFGYSVFTQSIGSGITSRFTVFNKTIKEHEKINKGDLIKCLDYSVERGYFTLKNFEKIL